MDGDGAGADGREGRRANTGHASAGEGDAAGLLQASGESTGPRSRLAPTPAGGIRRGLVLGGGGVLGFAWMVGALRALEDEEGFDVRDVEVCVGTSAGSILAALIGMGVGTDAILRHQQGIPLPADPRIDWDHDIDVGGALPPLPTFGFGSTNLLWQVARHPRQVPPLVAASALVPRGRGTLKPIGRMIDGLASALLVDRPALAAKGLEGIGGTGGSRVPGASGVPAGRGPDNRRPGSSPWTTVPVDGWCSVGLGRRQRRCPTPCSPRVRSPVGIHLS
jgi:NTE family protein